MSDSASEPVPPPGPEGAAPDAAPDAGDGSGSEVRRTRWIVALSTVLTVVVVAAVIVLAREASDRQAHGGTDLAPLPQDGTGLDRPGTRQTGWPDPACAPDPERPPHLVVDLPREGLDFGMVKQGVHLEQRVTFRNDGPGLLCIRSVEAPCGCIKADLEDDKRRYEPGETGAITIRLDSTGRSGQQRKTVRLYTNDLDSPLHTIDVHADISAGLLASPSALSFGRLVAGRGADAVVTLRSIPSDKDWQVTDVVGTTPVDAEDGSRPEVVPYTWEAVETGTDARYRTVEVRIHHPGQARQGPFQDVIVVHTTHPDRPEIQVRAHLLVVPPVFAVPPRAALGYVTPENPRTVRILLAPGDDSVTFTVTGSEVLGPDGRPAEAGETGFVASTEQDEEGRWWAVVSYDGQPRTGGQLEATLVVHTDRADTPEVRIECSATVPKDV